MKLGKMKTMKKNTKKPTKKPQKNREDKMEEKRIEKEALTIFFNEKKKKSQKNVWKGKK